MISKLLSATLCATILATPLIAQAQDDSKAATIIIPKAPAENQDEWVHNIAPYLWAASLSGQIGIGGNIVDVDMEFEDILESLDFGGFLTINGQKGRWGYYIDIAYLKLAFDEKPDKGPISTIESDLEQLSLEAVISYDTYKTDQTTIQLYAGMTYVYLDTNIDITDAFGGKVKDGITQDWVDPIVGIKIHHNLNDQWYINLVGEIGGFGVGSDLLWQAMAGVGYNINDCWSLIGGYRHLKIDYENGDFLYDTDMGGVMIGAVYTF